MHRTFLVVGYLSLASSLAACGGSAVSSPSNTLQDASVEAAGSGGTGASGFGGAGGSTGGTAGKGGSGGLAIGGSGGTAPEGGIYCYDNSGCAADHWCDFEPAAPGLCATGGKAGLCKPRPGPSECPDYDHCPEACGCNGVLYCDACEAHTMGVQVTADSDWCKDAGAPLSCGGFGGNPCPDTMFCDYPDNDPCGGADSTGVCKPKPSCPDPGGSGACGCNGQYYLSECVAQASGTDVTGTLSCVAMDAGKACGGKMGIPCSPGQYCDYEPSTCGAGDEMGVCVTGPKPQDCPDVTYCPGVCGCDGEWYCTECEAHAAGVDDAPAMSSCGTKPDAGTEQYSAEAAPGGLDHIFVYKADLQRNVCLRLHLVAPGSATPGFTIPSPWAYGGASITNQASDCWSVSPSGDSAYADKAQGVVSFTVPDGGYYPCQLDVHVTVSFSAGPPWVNPIETMNADQVAVGGGC